jgi:hypothetical protein
MAEVRVQLPLGAFCLRCIFIYGVLESLEIRLLREQETVGSNPTAPTPFCGGARVGTGGRLLRVISQVRFLPPQLSAGFSLQISGLGIRKELLMTAHGTSAVRGAMEFNRTVRKGKPMGDGSCFENSRAMSLEGSTPSPSACLTLGDLGDLLVVGCLTLNQATDVRIVLSELAKCLTCIHSGAVADGSDAWL